MRCFANRSRARESSPFVSLERLWTEVSVAAFFSFGRYGSFFFILRGVSALVNYPLRGVYSGLSCRLPCHLGVINFFLPSIPAVCKMLELPRSLVARLDVSWIFSVDPQRG